MYYKSACTQCHGDLDVWSRTVCYERQRCTTCGAQYTQGTKGRRRLPNGRWDTYVTKLEKKVPK
jgi:PHP family Zn ribbon phosphoesterase